MQFGEIRIRRNLVALAIAHGLCTSVAAGTISVNSLLDTSVSGDGECTLREAIANADSDSQSNSIDCAAGQGVDDIQIVSSGMLQLLQGDLVINSSMRIRNVSGSEVTISGNDQFRPFTIAPNSYQLPVPTVEMVDLSIANGLAAGSTCCASAVLSRAALTIANCRVFDNFGSDVDRIAAISQRLPGSLELIDSVVSSNVGAGIEISDASLEMRRSSVNNNSSYGVWVGGTADDPVVIESSSIHNNGYSQGNPGIFLGGSRNNGNDLVVNSSIVQNRGNSLQGGVHISQASVDFQFSTIAGNSNGPSQVSIGLVPGVPNPLSIAKGSGPSPASLTITNSIVSQNGDSAPACSITTGYEGVVTLVANSDVISTDGSCDQASVSDADLGTFDFHAGLTRSFDLLPTSPAINAVPAADCLELDQRGLLRALDGFCDTGSFDSEGLANLIFEGGFESNVTLK